MNSQKFQWFNRDQISNIKKTLSPLTNTEYKSYSLFRLGTVDSPMTGVVGYRHQTGIPPYTAGTQGWSPPSWSHHTGCGGSGHHLPYWPLP